MTQPKALSPLNQLLLIRNNCVVCCLQSCPSEYHVTCWPLSYKNAGLFSLDGLMIHSQLMLIHQLSADLVHVGVRSFSLLSSLVQQYGVPHSCRTRSTSPVPYRGVKRLIDCVALNGSSRRFQHCVVVVLAVQRLTRFVM